MGNPILTTKFFIPTPRQNAIQRPELVARLNAGQSSKLTLISAPAGFGKTTLVSEWIAECAHPVAWLSLDAGDSDPKRFLTYLVAALQTVAPDIGSGVLGALQAPQPPPVDTLLTGLINELAALPDGLTLILDDYHSVDAEPVDHAVRFLLDHLPPSLRLVMTTREDPQFPLAQWRARGQLIELRAQELRFSSTETAAFLNQAMGLDLSEPDLLALDARTEGWIAGLQLAALSMQRHPDTSRFIQSFTGSHHFVLDYLVEEVLLQQPEAIQRFLLHTAILERMCGPLCEAVLECGPDGAGQTTLAALEHANLFIVPLDNERRWYRYHHLFAELLRQRLTHSLRPLALDEQPDLALAELHQRASQWYEDNGLDIEAFHHAAAANDIARAVRLIESGGLPLQFRGGAVPVINWLITLPKAVLDERPVLWITWGSALLILGQVVGVAEKAQAAADALPDTATDEPTRDLIGRVASIRSSVAVTQHKVEDIIPQSRRALEYLSPNNLSVRASISWTLGYAHQLQGDRAAATQAYSEAEAQCLAVGHRVIAMMATIGLGMMQELDNLLNVAAETFQRALPLAGDPPAPPICDAYLGLARISYQWNDLEAAQRYAEQSLPLARLIKNTDRFVACELVLGHIKLAQGDVSAAAQQFAAAANATRQHNFKLQVPNVVAAEVLVALRQDNLAAAAELAAPHPHTLSQARVFLAQGDAVSALAVLVPMQEQFIARQMKQERLQVTALLSVAHHQNGNQLEALSLLVDALAQAEPSGFIRIFVDEGVPMAHLLADLIADGIRSDYIERLLAVFVAVGLYQGPKASDRTKAAAQPLLEPMTERELEVLQLIAQGLSNQQISARLFRALSTVKGHNRTIFAKLQVQRRTEAIARARDLGLL